MVIMFFFSSRRRHTRCLSDWSSDVCSSDLSPCCTVGPDPGAHRAARARHSREEEPEHRRVGGGARDRSEERRVGKECRSGWTTRHYNEMLESVGTNYHNKYID